MKNKKGFTLIELLAVIVVLAIIALIATPIVMNTIKNAKKGAAERSADNYVKAVEQAVAESRIDGTKIANGTYNIQSDSNLCPVSGCGENDKDKITIDMSGNKPTSGTVTISNGGVSQDGTSMIVGDYAVSYDKDNNKQQAQELYKGVLCKANTAKATAILWDGENSPNDDSSYKEQEVGLLASETTSKYDVGVTYTCELGDNDIKTFFILEANGDNVSLIMNANVDSNGKEITSSNIPEDDENVAWITNEDYLAVGGVVTNTMKKDNGPCQTGNICVTTEYGPVTAETTLKTRTTKWTRLISTQITLPTANQIAEASNFSFNGEGVNGNLKPWLIANIELLGTNGYWTSTSDESDEYKIRAFSVYGTYRGGIDSYAYTIINSDYGIRPVITISKSQLD